MFGALGRPIQSRCGVRGLGRPRRDVVSAAAGTPWNFHSTHVFLLMAASIRALSAPENGACPSTGSSPHKASLLGLKRLLQIVPRWIAIDRTPMRVDKEEGGSGSRGHEKEKGERAGMRYA
jgi:hypothetical protein